MTYNHAKPTRDRTIYNRSMYRKSQENTYDSSHWVNHQIFLTWNRIIQSHEYSQYREILTAQFDLVS